MKSISVFVWVTKILQTTELINLPWFYLCKRNSLVFVMTWKKTLANFFFHPVYLLSSSTQLPSLNKSDIHTRECCKRPGVYIWVQGAEGRQLTYSTIPGQSLLFAEAGNGSCRASGWDGRHFSLYQQQRIHCSQESDDVCVATACFTLSFQVHTMLKLKVQIVEGMPQSTAKWARQLHFPKPMQIAVGGFCAALPGKSCYKAS